ncbi:MAG: hypothetical protein CGW95_09245 [Phenylobacterium zucineum]|nr:MAG: hypothetical protein CGW95_09245 [Phenylobacterium zucineum]
MRLADKIDGALVRTAAQHVAPIRNAIAGSVDVDAAVEAFLNTFPIGSTVTPNQVREWARTNIPTKTSALVDILHTVYATGYVLGEDSSNAHYGNASLAKDASPTDFGAAIGIDWSKWKPGNRPAELLVRGRGRLRQLLNRTNATIKDISDTTLNRIGTVLADGLRVGAAGDTVAREFMKAGIKDLLNDPRRAVAIANTEMARAMSVASVDNYQNLGVEQVEWIGMEPCDLCQENEDAGPVDMGGEFPSGDTEPPAHPNCRCTIAPVVEGQTIKTTNPDLTKRGVPGPVEVERALSRLIVLPNPAHPELASMGDEDKYVESPWRTVEVPTVDPNVWDNADLALVKMADLVGTDPYLRRKNVKKHIKNMGQAVTPYRSNALIVVKDGANIIIDGHHRLMARWLLGQDTAPVWKVEI